LRRAGTFRCSALCGVLVATLGACRSVAVLPNDESWTITGADENSQATWSTGPVRVTVPLELSGDKTKLSGTIRNAGTAAVVTFVPSAEVHRRGLNGAVSGARVEAAGRWTAPVLPGQSFELPAGTPESPGTVDFVLPPDRPWTAKEIPAVGSTITWVVEIADDAGEASCPVFFHVSAANPDWVDHPTTAAVVTLIGFAGLIVWGAYFY